MVNRPNILTLPVPIQTEHNWGIFKPCIERFAATWEKFPPGCPCTLYAVCLGNEPDSSVKKILSGLPVEWITYYGQGFDIGAALWVANFVGPAFQVGMNSRVFFHRAGWLDYLRQARDLYGMGLFGTSASKESGRLHIRTSCYGIDTEDLKVYPYTVQSREDGYKFESGENCLLDWCEVECGWPSYVVYWDGVRRKEHFFTPYNIFRAGDQSNLLVWDDHTVRWSESDADTKSKLTRLAFEGQPPTDQSTGH